jgi:hypothetical protein
MKKMVFCIIPLIMVIMGCASSGTSFATNTAGSNAFNFPRQGVWTMDVFDGRGEWKGDCVVNRILNDKFYGYFDWVCTYANYSGKEYFEATYDTMTRKVTFKGTRSEGSVGTGIYYGYMAKDLKDIVDGAYGDGHGSINGTWRE